jgi:predicted site-specific integrase-resolvase
MQRKAAVHGGSSSSSSSSDSSSEPLKGWKEIADYLGLPISAAQRWAKSGMPITREGRRVQSSAGELNRWMGRETSEPVHIATESADLSAELRRGLSYVKKQKQTRNKERAA